MAQLISVKLSRFDGSPWGFRLQGGKDFGTPLIVQKVNGGSPAEVAGLRAGDAVVRVNTTDMYNLRHKDAQDVIMRAGNNFEITVQRGGSTWKPSVTPISSNLPSPVSNMSGNVTPVTKTSLAAKKQDGTLIGSGHNFSPKPFLNGSSDGPIKSIVNKQYNSPVGIYSEETIAETLSAQAEVLAGGVLGVNFKKNEKNYNAENSEVFKMVQEADKEPKTPEPVPSRTEFYSAVSHAVGGRATSPRSPTPLYHALGGSRPASATHENPAQRQDRRQDTPFSSSSSSSSSMAVAPVVCSHCDSAIVGVFVRIKEKNLHVECFKCSTCGTSLKNVGYYNINNKLYCDIHAKLVARQNAPATGLVPVTVPPGGRAPASTISAALANAPMSPPLSNHGSSPQPFSASTTSNLIGPKPFGATSTVLSTPSTPTLNSGNSTLPRPQSQTVTEVHEQSSYYEIVKETTSRPDNPTESPTDRYPSPRSNSYSSTHRNPRSNPRCDPRCHSNSMPYCNPRCNPDCNPNCNPDCNLDCNPDCDPDSDPSTLSRSSNPHANPTKDPSSVKSKSFAWPPSKPIEDITYPTASPLYIDPNPKFERGSRRALRDKRASIEACERALSRRRGESADREVYCREEYFRQSAMDRVSCQGGPVYRKVELIEAESSRRSQGETSRASSADGVRRSLTPTRIVQPIPKPWTPSPCTGGKLYQKSYAEPPKVCQTVSSNQREVCHRERVCKRESRTEGPYRDEQTSYKAEVCRMEQTVCKPPLPTARQEEEREEREETADKVCRQGVGGGEHDLITETTEEDVGNMRVKTKSTFEKTVEPLESSDAEETQETEEHAYSRIETVKRETENILGGRTVSASAETVTSAVDATQLCEQAKREEEEEEERKRQEEEEEEKRRRRQQQEEEEERKRREEEEEKNKKHVSFEDDSEEIVEEIIEKPLGRTVVHEERITEEDGGSTGRSKVIKETYEEVVEEVLVRERIRRRDVGDDQRRKSLREQVEVHQSLRDQERRQSQDRRVSSKYEQPQETMEMSKKHVQFMKQTESGPRPIPHSALRENAAPKEWKSEMVNALTTAPERPFTPLSTSSSVKELYTEETIYLDHRGRARLHPKEESRPISPFQRALTIAPERPYTPLSREIGPDDQNICRSETPVCYGAKEGPCPPLDILYGDATFKETCVREQHTLKKSTVCAGPRPLPTPPPDFRLRDTSPSAARSRSQTPSTGRPFSVGLKKPDAIPSYQRNLVAMKKDPVESHHFIPSRTPTPTTAVRSKSPVQRVHSAPSPSPAPSPAPSPRYHYSKAQAPRIRQVDAQAPPAPATCSKQSSTAHFPTRRSVTYKVDEDTDTGHISNEYAASRTTFFDKKEDGGPGSSDAAHAQYQERRIMTSEEQSEEKNSHCHTKRSLQVVEDFERCERRKSAIEAAPSTDVEENGMSSRSSGQCAIAKTGARSALPCPFSRQTDDQEIARPTYASSTTEVRHVRYDDVAPTHDCPDTGVTVLPCKAHSDKGTKAGVVVVPCEGPKPNCSQSGVCVVPTTDRSGVCVSPCFGMKPGTCGQPSGLCGQRAEIELPRNCPESGICVAPCADGSVCVAPCKKQGGDTRPGCNRGGSSKNLPFPQIPLPFEEFPNEQGCPANDACSSRAGCPVIPRCDSDTFGPNPAARTNLSGQLARLTAKRDVPTVQLYKAQCQADNLCRESFSRTTQSHQCQTWSQCQSQNCCQDQTTHYSSSLSKTHNLVDPPNLSSPPDLGSGVGGLGGAGSKSGSFAGSSAPKRGKGILNQAGGAGSRVPLCAHCSSYVRGPFITALGQIWCPDHFVCVNTQCRRPLQDIGFVEEKGQLYCEYCFERFIAPTCNKCNNKIKGDCLNAIGKHFHPECFNCSYCGMLFGNSPFFLEEGLPYCEADWNELFTTKCFACGFPVEAGDRWVEALNNNYHSQCFNCSMCKKNLEGQSFYAKGGRPFCKNHAR